MLRTPTLESYVPWWWKYGGRREFWAVFEHQIGEFIEKNSLTALSKEAQMGLASGPIVAPTENPTTTTREKSAYFPIWWYGTMKAAHLHYKGNIYVLQPEQWAKFTGPILEKLKVKLNAAKTVNFGKMMDLSEAINEIV